MKQKAKHIYRKAPLIYKEKEMNFVKMDSLTFEQQKELLVLKKDLNKDKLNNQLKWLQGLKEFETYKHNLNLERIRIDTAERKKLQLRKEMMFNKR